MSLNLERIERPYGYVMYHQVYPGKDDYYEYGELNNPHWKLCDVWYAIDYIKVNITRHRLGGLLIKELLDALPSHCGILANPYPTIREFSFEKLVVWYFKLGFIQFSGVNSLYKIK